MLFNQIAYGPIHSRRLGVSLGMNVMPLDHKLCTFDCVYCELGFNSPISRPQVPERAEIASALEAKLLELKADHVVPDVITFSGNGEPTLHPHFEGIIEDTCRLRDRLCPSSKVSVLSNSTQLHRPDVVRGLMQCDNRILKLDSAFDDTMRLIDQPVNADLTVERLVEQLCQFGGQLTVQTCFLRGEWHGRKFDNTTDREVTAWIELLRKIGPQSVMIYVIDRATPVLTLEKIDRPTMEVIAARVRSELNIPVSVSA